MPTRIKTQFLLRVVAIVVAVGAAGLMWIDAVRSVAADSHVEPALALQEPIQRVDARLKADGWMVRPERQPLATEHALSGNRLDSLSSCSGTGLGFCRYDYQRRGRRFAVVTVPGPQGTGVVAHWFDPDR